MATIRITSDPYKREIKFDVLKKSTDEWVEVSFSNNPESRLITEDIRKNFFPYKVKEIVRILRDEYLSDDEMLTIYFNGTTDEYHELNQVCNGFIDDIKLFRSDEGLENARDILPKIVDIFSEIQPIVDANIGSLEVRSVIEHDIAKFTDASNDIVPICVLGNYSSGKSTFINALIGMEILPSGDMPVTAKIYSIRQSSDPVRSHISLKYNEESIDIDICGNDFIVERGEDSEFVDEIINSLQDHKEASLANRVNACLDVINGQRKGVSDLIDITVPFGYGSLRESRNSFVIFDTPGSNTATYKDHFSILEGAMKDMSNGIPIYIAEYSSLDSCDNESLYEKIKSISQIDSRFTMIVVNKADSANIKEDRFDEDTERMILRQAVPRNLYSGGIYFVSSIMGLGSKNNGEFFDDHAVEFFEDNERKYMDVRSKRYKSLYKFDIMPEQIKHCIVDASENSDNMIFANSGLLAAEHEIVNFAEKYSAYDKCEQSNKYVRRILDKTQDQIDEIRRNRESKKIQLQKDLENDKKELIGDLEKKREECFQEYSDTYDESIKGRFEQREAIYSYDDMNKWEKIILSEKESEHNFTGKKNSVKESGVEILNDVIGIGKGNVIEGIRDVGGDIQKTWDNTLELKNIKLKVNKETGDELIRAVSDDYNDRLGGTIKDIDTASREHCEKYAECARQDLLEIVTSATALDEEKKQELSDIIISYGNIVFGDEHAFEKNEFEKQVRLLCWVIDLNKIDTRKLTDAYNRLYIKKVKMAYGQLKNGHGRSFESWLEQLVNRIRLNIVDYSPKLSEQVQRIVEETRAIDELENTKSLLNNYSDQIEKLMDWEVLA